MGDPTESRRAPGPHVGGRSAAALACASAGLYALCFTAPPEGRAGHAAAALAWTALVPLCLALRGRGPAAAAGVGALWALGATAGTVFWLVRTLQDHFEWSLPGAIGFLAGVSAVSAAPFVAAAFGLGAVARRGRGGGLHPLAFAASFVAAEFLRGQLGLRSPWAPLGATQASADHVRQVADLVGVHGVSGLVAFGNAVLAEWVVRFTAGAGDPRTRRRRLRTTLAALALLAATFTYGAARLGGPQGDDRAPAAGGPLPFDVAVVQGNVESGLRWRRSQASRILRRYGGATRDLLRAVDDGTATSPPDLIVWPENAIQTPVDDPIYGRPLQALARAGTPLLIGAPRHEQVAGGTVSFNSAHLIASGGRWESYDKRLLLPFAETRPWNGALALERRGDLEGSTYVPGSEPGLFALEQGVVGVLICLEALHPGLAREAVAEGADLLVVLSNDAWFAGPTARRQHLGQVVLRAVETRRPLVRATTDGLTAIVAPDGSIAARLEPHASGVLRATIPIAGPARAPTFYILSGDLLPVACLLYCLGAALREKAGQRRAP